MGKYGSVAVIAAELLAVRADLQPPEAWRSAAGMAFPNSASSRDKSCPRGAFLGLCEVGAVEGVGRGSYTPSVKNKEYAVKGLTALRSDPSLASDEMELWRIAMDGQDKQHNSQMDVLIALWRCGKIKAGARSADPLSERPRRGR
jgi:hypothetical protein